MAVTEGSSPVPERAAPPLLRLLAWFLFAGFFVLCAAVGGGVLAFALCDSLTGRVGLGFSMLVAAVVMGLVPFFAGYVVFALAAARSELSDERLQRRRLEARVAELTKDGCQGPRAAGRAGPEP